MRIGLATCKTLPEPDLDEAPLVAALRDAQLDVQVLAWDEETAPFAEQDLVVLRSTWNYHERVDDFLAWVERTGATTQLLNPPRIVTWNVRKTYLTDLERRGVAIVPTEFVSRGEAPDVAAIRSRRGWDHIVIKPVVSAASFRTAHFPRSSVEAAQAFLDALVVERDVMVQEWMPTVRTHGERSLVWVDGVVTHAVRKSPRFAGGREHVSAAVQVADDERAFAEKALGPLARDLLYARVDMIRDASDKLRLMELELVEPSLFLAQSPQAVERLVAAVLRRLAVPRDREHRSPR